MREIKFRAWDKEKKHFASVYVQNMLKAEIHPQFELQQYTGLKDKNGVEIYEGDIVTAQHILTQSHTPPKRVIWNQDTARFNGLTNSNLRLNIVIGNMFETPELLEASND